MSENINNQYIGITIGPIYDTIRMTSSPSALWASSYIYSHIAKRICEEAVIYISGGEDAIISPYFKESEKLLTKNDGIGLFHDRIIIKTDTPKKDMKSILDIFDKVKIEIAKLFKDDESTINWFKQFLQLHAVVFECDKKPILNSSKYLDTIELKKTFPDKIKENPFTVLFEDKDKNLKIYKQIKEKLKLSSWPFSLENKKIDNTMPEMKYIIGKKAEKIRSKSKNCKPEKAYSYYAIVQSDGDHFGKYIETFENDNQSQQVSKNCLTFCSEAANIIQDYGGVTIYAGGDDLLFIAPLLEKPNEDISERKNLINLLNDIKDKFECIFRSENPPTISFGVAIRYLKYPLYEAFDETYDMLFNHAKNKRDSLATSLQKHSGQSIEFVIENFKKSVIPKNLTDIIKVRKDREYINSVSTKIWQYKALFEKALSINDIAVENAFFNIINSELHTKKYNENDIKDIIKLLIDINCSPVREIGHIKKKKKDISKEEEKLYSLDALLRFIKFYSESGEEEDDDDSD